ncbi:hypothetical protein ODU63_003398 [Vibrio cholerae]|nr:hypothetical protein [Vibrio cholerae]
MTKVLGEIGLVASDSRINIKFEEQKMIYLAKNNGRKKVHMYDVDGKMISSGSKKCDKALVVPINEEIYLIELKGCDLKKAATQIYETINYLGDKLDGHKIHGRIVCSRMPKPDIKASQVVRLERELAKRKGNLKKNSQQLQEDI